MEAKRTKLHRRVVVSTRRNASPNANSNTLLIDEEYEYNEKKQQQQQQQQQQPPQSLQPEQEEPQAVAPTQTQTPTPTNPKRNRYDLGVGKNKPLVVASTSTSTSHHTSTNSDDSDDDNDSHNRNHRLDVTVHWNVPEFIPRNRTKSQDDNNDATVLGSASSSSLLSLEQPSAVYLSQQKLAAREEMIRQLRGALWDETQYQQSLHLQQQQQQQQQNGQTSTSTATNTAITTTATTRAKSQTMQMVVNGHGSEPPQSVDSPFQRKEERKAAHGASISVNNANDDNYDDEEQLFLPTNGFASPKRPTAFYPNIDLSIPDTVYSDDGSVDLVWDLLRWEAYQEAQREPLLVSFLHSTILNHPSLESSLAFLLANRLQSPAMMISTQLQSIIFQSLSNNPVFRRSLRADMMAVRDRDPACHGLPDVFLYFKGFHALQAHRVAHCLWNREKFLLASYLQSQVSQVFQIDIHPNAQLGSGIMLDHGTGIVIGETATIGHNCSILHHVTLGGSGKKGVVRHPTVGDGVLLGAGATVLGPVTIGEGSQVGAGTLVISDLPSHCVAVGVPARIIGSFVDVTEQPSIGMDQVMAGRNQGKIFTFESGGI